MPTHWRRLRSFRRPARKSAGRTWKFANARGDHAMTIRRREFLKATGATALYAGLSRGLRAADSASLYDIERFGNARILHMTDTHAQLKPVYFRGPSINLGIG